MLEDKHETSHNVSILPQENPHVINTVTSPVGLSTTRKKVFSRDDVIAFGGIKSDEPKG